MTRCCDILLYTVKYRILKSNFPGWPLKHYNFTPNFSNLSTIQTNLLSQRAKKVVSDSPGLVDFAIGQVNSVFKLPNGQVMFFEEFE